MALGDELVRGDDNDILDGPVGLSEVSGNPEVEDATTPLGEEITGRGGGDVDINIPQDLGSAIVRNRQEIPPDDDQTPPGRPAPSEVSAAADAVKKIADASATPGAKELSRSLGIEVRPAGQEQLPEGSVADAIRGGSAEVTRRTTGSATAERGGVTERNLEAARGQAGERNLRETLTDPAVTKVLAALGQAIDPSRRQPLGDVARQIAESTAQDEFRARLQTFGEEGAAAPGGISPEGAQSVLQAFRGEQQREAERELAGERQELAEEREARQQRLTEAEIEQVREGIRQADEELDLQKTRLAIEQGRLTNAEERLALDKLNSKAQRMSARALANLRNAKAEVVGQDDGGGGGGMFGLFGGDGRFSDLIDNTDQVLGRLQSEIDFLSDREENLRNRIVGLRQGRGIFSDLDEEERQERLEEAQKTRSQTVKNLRTLEANREALNTTLGEITDFMTRGQNGGEEESIPEFETEEELQEAAFSQPPQIVPGDTIRHNGTLKRLTQDFQLVPVE